MASIRITPFNNADLRSIANGIVPAIEKVLDTAADRNEARFNATTATWTGSPKAKTESTKLQRTTGVDDERWDYVVNGTRAHIIRPRRANGVLAFQTGYNRKTQPRVFGSSSGGASGGMVYAREVRHPGNEAGEHNLLAAEIESDLLPKDVNEAIQRLVG